MIRIFLAHASEDKPAVTDLYYRLKESGFEPWFDKVNLLAGQSWRAEIPKAIKNSHVFIACLSQQSVKKQGYIQREFRMALNHMADRPPGQIFLIPVRLDKCQIPDLRQEEYGISLSDYQWVDLYEPDGYDRLVQGIRATFADMAGDDNADEVTFPEQLLSTAAPVTSSITNDVATQAEHAIPVTNWSGAQIDSLHKALLSAYPTEPGLKRMLRTELDVHLNQIAEGANHSERMFAVIEALEAESRLPELIKAAQRGNPGNTKLQILIAKLSAS
ncbi:TIR domain-containing protein [Adonisia turfae]|uniref:Toll/interleukin-1 receptor domain-containing protein n=1 Tax=Adonisia turfae CCMR0081 TaxID=2292702 RepID=A0A6M0RWW1_9CYAN|nr:TIR domain-containing protein [Adonisia turfae]NEZ60333.1 toll/interleukin-1 receptor domain-containing protein [Adonisia turfae CCMR0081]